MDNGQIESIKNELVGISEQLSKSHKSNKPTKKELIEQEIPKLMNEKLREAHIKGLVQGWETANQLLLDYAKTHTLTEVVVFCEMNVKNKDMMVK